MTKQTLKDRLLLAMEGPPRVSPADLARACKIKPPSVSNWLNGKVKTIKGDNLMRAATKLNVSPEWLSMGAGPMRRGKQVSVGETLPAQYDSHGTAIATATLDGLYTSDMVLEVAQALRKHAARHGKLFDIETAAGAEAFLHWLRIRAVLPDMAALENVIELDSRRTSDNGEPRGTRPERESPAGAHGKRQGN